MADPVTTPSQPGRGGRDRSPSFPFISLALSVKRLQSVEKKFGRHAVPYSKAGLVWSMQPDSSQAQQTLAALKAYGLMVYEGPATDRRASISDLGRLFLRAQQESVRLTAAREAVLKPKIFLELFSEWGAKRPPDAICLDDLVRKRRFTETAAARLLRVYDKNVEFAQLTDKHEADTQPPSSEMQEGSYVSSWTSDAEKNASTTSPQISRTLHIAARTNIVPVIESSAEGFSEVFSVDSGRVTLSWPKALSADEAVEVEAWLDLIVRKIKRRSQST